MKSLDTERMSLREEVSKYPGLVILCMTPSPYLSYRSKPRDLVIFNTTAADTSHALLCALLVHSLRLSAPTTMEMRKPTAESLFFAFPDTFSTDKSQSSQRLLEWIDTFFNWFPCLLMVATLAKGGWQKTRSQEKYPFSILIYSPSFDCSSRSPLNHKNLSNYQVATCCPLNITLTQKAEASRADTPGLVQLHPSLTFLCVGSLLLSQ